MNPFRRLPSALVLLVAASNSFAQGSAFTYQGRLTTGTEPANGQYEMSFTLFDAVTNGNAVGAGQTVAPVAVSNGLFTVTLDFGFNAFNGPPRWLEISVNLFGSDMIPTVLVPRQRITSAPYAIQAANAAGLMSFVNTPLDIKVNGERALRLEPTSPFVGQIVGAPNVIGGSSANWVSPDATGATIAGGGAVSWFGTDGRHAIESKFAAIGGGVSNSISTQADGAVIGGGSRNTIRSEGVHSTISGGFFNIIQEDAGTATISGGRENNVTGDGGTIGGGWGNTAAGYATVAGGQFNFGGSAFATVSGGSVNEVLGSHGTIGGGSENTAGAPAEPNIDHAYATIGGGLLNQTVGDYSTIGGGYHNFGTNEGTTIAGGFLNTASNFYATVGGGVYNFVKGYGATIAGGGFNRIERGDGAGGYSAIGGGTFNVSRGDHVTIGGGSANSAAGNGATIGGGANNVIETNAEFGAIPGGHQNQVAQPYGVAAGRGAQALHAGAFVWADATVSNANDNASFMPFPSTNTNEFAARATGGVRFVTAVDGAGTPVAGATLAPGSGAWSMLSDRNAKENLVPANARAVLEKVAALPLATWNYKSQDRSIRHLGPMAQDFHAAFALGEDDRTITTVDADGVALAAIQGLNQKVEEENRALRAALQSRDREIEELKQGLAQLRESIGRR